MREMASLLRGNRGSGCGKATCDVNQDHPADPEPDGTVRDRISTGILGQKHGQITDGVQFRK